MDRGVSLHWEETEGVLQLEVLLRSRARWLGVGYVWKKKKEVGEKDHADPGDTWGGTALSQWRGSGVVMKVPLRKVEVKREGSGDSRDGVARMGWHRGQHEVLAT